jgi:hypothetical protein
MTNPPTPRTVGLVGVGAIATVLVVLVAFGPLEVVDLVAPGRAGSGGDVMVHDFGAASIPDGFAYDGQTVYLGARALPDLDAAIQAVPGPDYRLRRILVPLLASPGGTGNTVVLLITFWGVVGLGLATWGLAELAARAARDPRLGYAATAALAFPTVIGTSESLAFGLGFAGLALAARSRLGWAAVTLALAGLARETALVFAMALALDLLLDRRIRAAVAVSLGSTVPFLLWNALLQSRVTAPASESESTELFGFLHLPSLDAVDVAVSGVALVLMVTAIPTWRGVRQLQLVAAGFLASCALYVGDQYRWPALIRVSAAAVALGLAGLGDCWLRWRAAHGTDAPVAPSPGLP